MAEDEVPVKEGRQTKLLYTETSCVDKANRVFGACYDGNTVIMINPGYSMFKPYLRVPEGMYALVQNQGRDMNCSKNGGSPVWSPGFHWAGPWTQVSHLVTKQFIVFETPVKGCKTKDNVTVNIDMCLILRIMGDESKGEDPELVRRFVYEMGPNGLEVQLRAAQDEAVRALARAVEHTEVYKLRDGSLQDAFNTGRLQQMREHEESKKKSKKKKGKKKGKKESNSDVEPMEIKEEAAEGGEDGEDGEAAVEEESPQEAEAEVPEAEAPEADSDEPTNPDDPETNKSRSVYYVTEDIKKNLNAQFNPYGVQITNVAITDVKLPPTFEEQMQSRTTHTSSIKEQNMKQLSDMQMLSYKEEIDTTKLSRKMMLMEEEQTGKAKCAEIRKEIDMVKTEVHVIEDTIAQETRVRCNKIVAEAALTIEQIHADTKRISSEIAYRSETDINLVRAEEEAIRMQLKAEMEEILSTGQAKAMEIVARAEGTAAKKLEKYRAHMVEMQRLDVLTSLSKNPKTVVTGNASNSLLAEMMVANQHSNVMLNVGDGGLKGLLKAS